MYEIFDLNGRPVFNIDPATGIVSYLYQGKPNVVRLAVGEDRRLVRNGAVTRVIRDTTKTFAVELGIETEIGSTVKQYSTEDRRKSRITLLGEDTDGSEKRAFDIISKNGCQYIETKDTRGHTLTVSVELISKAIEQLIQQEIG